MNADYAAERLAKQHVIFRYKVRACVVATMAKKYGDPGRPIHLLDLGCADGRTLLEIRNRLGAGEYIGIESSRALLDQAPEMPDNIKLLHGDAACLPKVIPKDFADVVTALALLEHLKDPIQVLREAHRVLKPGGIFIATCPHPWWDHLSGALGLHRDEFHQQEMNKFSLLTLLRDADLNIVEYQRFMWAPAGFLPYLRVPITAEFSCGLDRAVAGLHIFDCLFVNQCVVARKPLL